MILRLHRDVEAFPSHLSVGPTLAPAPIMRLRASLWAPLVIGPVMHRKLARGNSRRITRHERATFQAAGREEHAHVLCSTPISLQHTRVCEWCPPGRPLQHLFRHTITVPGHTQQSENAWFHRGHSSSRPKDTVGFLHLEWARLQRDSMHPSLS